MKRLLKISLLLFLTTSAFGQMKPMLGTQIDISHPLSDFVGFWPMWEGSGNKVFDLSGNGNDISLVHDPTWVGGKFGSSLLFDGTNDYGSVSSEFIDIIETSNAFTVVAWVLNTNLTTDSSVASQWGTTNQFQLWMDTGGAGDGYVFIVSGNEGNAMTSSDSINAKVNTWQQVVASWDGIYASIYIDGLFDNSQWAGAAQIMNSSTELMGIGSEEGDRVSRGWPGNIDHILFYNRALSPSEVALLLREPFCMFDEEDIALMAVEAAPAPSGGQVIIIQMTSIPFIIGLLVFIKRRREERLC